MTGDPPANLRGMAAADEAGVRTVFPILTRRVGEMLDGLDQKGLADKTVVIYTADHGDALGKPWRPGG